MATRHSSRWAAVKPCGGDSYERWRTRLHEALGQAVNQAMGAAQALAGIDWTAPWLQPWRCVGEQLAAQVVAGMPVTDALNATGRAPVQFVPQSALPHGCAYEQHIFATACVPTREGLHDFFNGLAWILFPHTKKRMNALQAEQIAHRGIQPVRGAARDALTLVDENAALLVAPDPLWDALCHKEWGRVFGTLRPLWQHAWPVLFGHALLEKLVHPHKSITAHVIRVQPASPTVPDIDACVTDLLTESWLVQKPFAHLPVLGVPGWLAANEDPGFYNDPAVFRAARPRQLPAQRP